MFNFKDCLDSVGEVGLVEEIHHSIVYVSGLPKLKPDEIVVFENGQIGETLSLSKDSAEILILSEKNVKVGDKLARTNKFLSIELSDEILGKVIDPLGNSLNETKYKVSRGMKLNSPPPDLMSRKPISESLETGVSLVDLIIPIGVGQRELIIGDRKTGKTQFFIRTILNQAQKGNICIYASIGKKIDEIKEILEGLKKKGIADKCIVVASSASDAPGLIFITPYTAMAIAEYFKDQGKNVILILDDLTNHAVYYRQISLLAGRFPGRNSYPGDIFYVHSRLLERAGNFKTGSITCFPVAESILGDLSGYIQTNLMSITDGHIFFDSEMANLGRRPAINPFLSVTRVGQQSQTQLVREISRELSSFLISTEELQGFLHFGAELSEEISQKIKLGNRILDFFNQPVDTVPINMSILIISMLWIGTWRDQKTIDMKSKMKKMILDYDSNAQFKKAIDDLILKTNSFRDFLNSLREGSYGQQNYY
ncbi:F0F1 ATP synthase subunit alpha [soil metagenome]